MGDDVTARNSTAGHEEARTLSVFVVGRCLLHWMPYGTTTYLNHIARLALEVSWLRFSIH